MSIGFEKQNRKQKKAAEGLRRFFKPLP